MNRGEYVTESAYATPLPRTPVERRLWDCVIAIHKKLTRTSCSCGKGGSHRTSLNSSAHTGPTREDTATAPLTSSLSTSEGTSRESLLCPLANYLESLTVDRTVDRVGASVVDVVLQIPDAKTRHDALGLALAFPKWSFDMCGPIAVAARFGDAASIKVLLRDKRLDPNCGFPLTLAVRHHHIAALQTLLASRRIRPNHGGPFFEAVTQRDLVCLGILIRHVHVNLSRFAKNKGTTPFQHAVRGFMQEVAADGSVEGIRPPSPPSPVPAPIVTSSTCPRRLSASGPVALPHVHCVPGNGGSGGSYGREDTDEAHHSPLPASLAPLESRPSPPPLLLSSLSTGSLLACDQRSQRGSQVRCRQSTYTPASWTEVLLFLLQHPSIDINSGFYATPLMTAVLADHAPLITCLLSVAHVRPNRVNPPVRGLAASMHQFKHVKSATADVAALLSRTPLEACVERRTTRCFELLVRDRRVTIPQSVWHTLEQHPEAEWTISFLEIIARYRQRWESWAWRWRRACLVAAQLSALVLSVLHWFFCTLWAAEFGRLHVVTAVIVTAAMVPMGLWCLCSRTTPCSSDTSDASQEKPSSDAMVTTVTNASPRCGLPPSVCRWLIWLSLVCAPVLPLWPLYSAWVTVQLGWVERGPWRRVHANEPPMTSTTAGASSTTAVAVHGGAVAHTAVTVRPGDATSPDGDGTAGNSAESRSRTYVSITDDDARSTASTATSASGASTSTSVTTALRGDDSALSAASSLHVGSPAAVPNHPSWGSTHLLHAVRRLSHHHHRRNSQDSDASAASTQVSEAVIDEDEDATAVNFSDGTQFILPQASAVPQLALRAALYSLYDRLLPTNVVISAVGFLVHLNFLFPFRKDTDTTPSILDVHNRTVLIFAGLSCFVCSLIEFTALMISCFCLQNASPSSLLSGAAKPVAHRPANARPNMLG